MHETGVYLNTSTTIARTRPHPPYNFVHFYKYTYYVQLPGDYIESGASA